MYVLTKFQPDMPLTLRVMVLQNGNNKKIDLYSASKNPVYVPLI